MYCGECDLVSDLVFRQEGVPQTHQSVLEISRNAVIGHTHHQLSFQNHPPTQSKNNLPISVTNVFSCSVMTQLR